MESRLKRWLLALIMALALVSIGSLGFAEEKKPSKGKVAVVNGAVITREVFNREVSRVQIQEFKKRGSLSDSQLAEINKKVLENLINRELLYQESQKNGIKVNENAVNERLMTIKKRFPGEAEFKNALSRINHTEETLKPMLKQGMTIQRLVEEQFAKKVKISDKEIKSYYKDNPNLFKQPGQVRASHILIKVDPHADESKKAKARKELEKIQHKLQKDEDFTSLAKEFSQGPSSAKGGDLGYFGRGQMVKPFEDVAFTLKPGEVSDIVETKFGYHLIKVVDKKPERTIAYEEIKGRIEQHLKNEEIQKRVSLYVEKLKENATVERFMTKSS